MKQAIITPTELISFMGKDEYYEFINWLKRTHKIDRELPIWIIAEWSPKKED